MLSELLEERSIHSLVLLLEGDDDDNAPLALEELALPYRSSRRKSWYLDYPTSAAGDWAVTEIA